MGTVTLVMSVDSLAGTNKDNQYPFPLDYLKSYVKEAIQNSYMIFGPTVYSMVDGDTIEDKDKVSILAPNKTLTTILRLNPERNYTLVVGDLNRIKLMPFVTHIDMIFFHEEYNCSNIYSMKTVNDKFEITGTVKVTDDVQLLRYMRTKQ